MKTNKYQGIIILSLMLLSGLLTNCNKDPEPDNNANTKFPSLIEGNDGLLHLMSYTVAPNYRVFDSFIKVAEDEFKLIGVDQEYISEHIQIYKGSNKLTLSNYTFNEAKYPSYDSAFFAKSHMYDVSFRNAHIVNEDSIIGEYYNTHYFNNGTREFVPDSGIFAIKILP